MTLDETAKIMMLLKTVWRDMLSDDKDEANAEIRSWQRIFQDRSFAEMEWAARQIMATNEFPPRPGTFTAVLSEKPTLADKQARILIEYHPEEDKYPDDLVIQSGFERAMRAVNESVPMTGNHFDVAEEYEKRKARG